MPAARRRTVLVLMARRASCRGGPRTPGRTPRPRPPAWRQAAAGGARCGSRVRSSTRALLVLWLDSDFPYGRITDSRRRASLHAPEVVRGNEGGWPTCSLTPQGLKRAGNCDETHQELGPPVLNLTPMQIGRAHV